MEIENLLNHLSDFNSEKRKESFIKIVYLIRKNKIKKNNEFKGWINIHIHTFHSFNYKNWSPLRILYEGWEKGLLYIGTVDFDTLEGVEETLWAGNLLNIKVTSGFESRVFLKEMEDKVINSPNEPGIFYLCGKGFKKIPIENSEEGIFFKKLKIMAQNRNRKVIEKVNKFLGEIKIDYEKDLLPLTPSHNPTERHIILAYYKKSDEILKEKKYSFWADILKIKEEKIEKIERENIGTLFEFIRTKLIKFGGPGYIKTKNEDFPLFDEVVKYIEKSNGIPIGTWLDGTSDGEKDPEILLELLKSKRIKGITIIPERNWNIKDENEKKLKLKKLKEFMNLCKKINMPVICGTEMNKYEQPFVDRFDRPEIKDYLEYFKKSFERLFIKDEKKRN